MASSDCRVGHGNYDISFLSIVQPDSDQSFGHGFTSVEKEWPDYDGRTACDGWEHRRGGRLMDLHLAGRRALVCAATKGLGRACAEALIAEGAEVVITGRDPKRLEIAAEQMGAAGFAAGDIAEEEGQRAALAACPEPDILVTNTGGPPLGRFDSFDSDDWMRAVQAMMIGPLALVRSVHSSMRTRQYGRIVNITSAYVKAPVELLPLSVGPRAGMTAALSWLAREGMADNVTINNLMPEMIRTDRAITGFARMAEEAGQAEAEFVASAVAALPARRLGTPDEFGALCAFLCSRQAAYITNQNIMVDGGHYPGLF